MKKLFKKLWEFIVEIGKDFKEFFYFTVYVKKGNSVVEVKKFDTIKAWATIFSTLAADGWIQILHFGLNLSDGKVISLNALAAFATGLYQYKKKAVDKYTPDSVHTVPTNTSFLDNVKSMAGAIKDKVL